MAKISDTAFRNYKDGQDRMTAQEYMRDREVLKGAINDLEDRYDIVVDVDRRLFETDALLNKAVADSLEAMETSSEANETSVHANATSAQAVTIAEQATETATQAVVIANQSDSKANSAVSTATQANTTAGQANTKADSAVTKANEANTKAGQADTKAGQAVTTANNANTTAGQASTKADSAISTANNANTKSDSANTKADQAVSTANAASTKSDSANSKSDSAVSTANNAAGRIDTAINTVNQTLTEVNSVKGEYLQIGKDVKDTNSRVSAVLDTDKQITQLPSSIDGKLSLDNVKGRTWQNIMNPFRESSVWHVPASYFTLLSDGYASLSRQQDIRMKKGSMKLLKPNTLYTIIFDIRKNTFDNRATLIHDSSSGTTTTPFTSSIAIQAGATGIQAYKINTKSDLSNITYDMWIYTGGITSGELEMRMMILEGDWTNKELPPYFEGIQSVGELEGKVSVKSVGKNLYETDTSLYTREVDYFTFPIYLKQNTAYSLNARLKGTSLEGYALGIFDNTTYMKATKRPTVLNTAGNVGSNGSEVKFNTEGTSLWYLAAYVPGGRDSQLLPNIFRNYEIQLEETKQTAHEPFKKSLIEIPLTEPLRSLPNGVADEIKDGKIIRRVGKVVFNGSENWTPNSGNADNMVFFLRASNDVKLTSVVIADKLPYLPSTATLHRNPGIALGPEYKVFYISAGLQGNTADIIKNWLQANPMTVYYELVTPTEQPITVPSGQSFKDGNLIVENTIIPSGLSVRYNVELANRLTAAEKGVSDIWRSLLPIADKELRMKSVNLLTTETTADLKNKLNEIITIWRV